MTRDTDHIPAAPFWRKALSRRRRGSVSLEAVLAFPVMMVVFGAIAQIMLLAQARLYVEQAAYAAARSALVHKCRPVDPRFAIKYPLSAAIMATCQDKPQMWENAASWALVGAAPSSNRGCSTAPQAAIEVFNATGPVRSHLTTALTNRLCYAFNNANVTVTVEWLDFVDWPLAPNTPVRLLNNDAAPIKATVEFKYPLTTPFRLFISDGKDGDHHYYMGSATVVLL
jgi:Flp pilus assembly protein TadG